MMRMKIMSKIFQAGFLSLPTKTAAISRKDRRSQQRLNPLNAELNPLCHLQALLGAHHILHVSRIRVNFSFCNST